MPLQTSEQKELLKAIARAESRLAEFDTLASVGLLASGIAHQLNSPLAGLIGLLRLSCVQAEQGDAPSREELDEMLAAAERMADIIRNMSAFVGDVRSDTSPSDLHDVIDALLQFGSSHMRVNGIRIVREYSEAPFMVRSERGRLQQIVLHVLLSAWGLMPEGGELRIGTGVDRAGHDASLVVTSDVTEVSADEVRAAFDPFHAEGRVPSRDGWGLWVARRLVEELGGSLNIVCEAGRGTEWRVRLPVAEAGRAPREPDR